MKSIKLEYILISQISFIVSFLIIAYLYKPATRTVTVEIPVAVVEVVYHETHIRYEQKLPHQYSCVDDKNCLTLAEAIYYEARGEDLEGQIAVGWVIMNRTQSKYFPDTITEVVRQSCQFSYRCDGSMKRGFIESEAYKQSIKVAKGIILGVFDDPTNGADHYLNLEKVKRVPHWARVYPKVASIGNHDFHVRNK